MSLRTLLLAVVSSPAMRMTLSSSTVPPQLSLKKQQVSLRKAEEVAGGKDSLNGRHVTSEGTTRQRPYMGVADGEVEGTRILKQRLMVLMSVKKMPRGSVKRSWETVQ